MWDNTKSLKLSLFITRVFCVALILFAIFAYPFFKWYVTVYISDTRNFVVTLLTVSAYFAMPPAAVTLGCLNKLLVNISKKITFEQENVKLLRIISWCCFYITAEGIILSIIYAPNISLSFIIITVAAFFVGLIVRVVKNVFVSAIEIKEENELTI